MTNNPPRPIRVPRFGCPFGGRILNPTSDRDVEPSARGIPATKTVSKATAYHPIERCGMPQRRREGWVIDPVDAMTFPCGDHSTSASRESPTPEFPIPHDGPYRSTG